MTFSNRTVLFAALVCGLALTPAAGVLAQQAASPAAPAQQKDQPAATQNQGAGQEPDPRLRRRSDQEQFKAQKAYKGEIHGAYKSWLEQDVPYIITDEETRAFKTLSNRSEERRVGK